MNRRFVLAAFPLILTTTAFGQHTPTACSSLAKLTLPHTTVLRAEIQQAGTFSTPDPAESGIYKGLPEFCRVIAQSAPTADSDIRIEVWLPMQGWNGKFRGQGNGGFAGAIGYSLMANSVSQGYATAGTDTGHTGESTDASWAIGHPEKVVDFGNRAIHEMTLTAKSVIDAYYGKSPEHSYFASCSDGGREALMEAQRFPRDYDGILAGAPAYYWTNMIASGMHKVQALTRNDASYIPAAKVPAIAAAVRAACDASDGVTDGILNDPRTCRFKPETLLCTSTVSDTCLTQPQVNTLKTFYAATFDAHGKRVYPASVPGGEDGPGGWAEWVVGSAPDKGLSYLFTTGYFKNMVYQDPAWNYQKFNLDEGLAKAIEVTATAINATETNLKPFSSKGGKLVLYHGWSDPAIAPLGTIDYYNGVQKDNPDAAAFVRLFMAPGMQHCTGGPGPSSFGQFGHFPGTGPDDAQHDLYLALEQWVEKGVAPEKVIAAKFAVDGKSAPTLKMTRPLCAYPQTAKYNGAGDPNHADSFTCSPK